MKLNKYFKKIIKYNIYSCVVIIIVLMSQSIEAQENLSLEDAIKIALKNNYSIRATTLQSKIAENSLNVGTGAFLPTLDLKITQDNTINDVNQNFYDGREVEKNGATGNSLLGSITANWKIFDGMGMFIDYDLLKLNNEVSRLQLRKKSEDLISQITASYNTLYFLNENLLLISQNLEVSRFRYNIVFNRKEIGKASGMELLQAEIDLNKDISDSIYALNNYEIQRNEFNILLGEPVDRQFKISDSLTFNSQSYSYASLQNELAQNTDLKLADLGIQISQNDIDRLKSNYLPTINLYGGYTYNSVESQAGLLKSNVANGFNYGVSLNLNLFEGFKNNTIIENQELNAQISKLNKEELEKLIQKELKSTIDSYNSTIQVKNIQEKNLLLSQSNLEIAKEKLRIGTITQIEFREIQLNQLNVFNQLLLTKINLKIFETSIQRILGMLVI
ncbi:MAG TPA: TolC family protein [Candidatus Kapabacteria bacterium]|nr:TolC family protein [Candidatus Kapabacteria bacterium]